MAHIFDSSRPIYTQLLEEITAQIVSGTLSPGAKLPAVRELAVQFGVNPNTAQRTMAELERLGLVRTERTAGRFVTTDKALIRSTRLGLARQRTEAFLSEMEKLGLRPEEVTALLTRQED